MIDCHFDGLGDDALNIHGLAAAIIQVAEDGKSIVCAEKHGHGLPDRWTEGGDTLTVYDAKTMLKKATLTDKDQEILRLRMLGHTEQEIADLVGYKTASAVHKRIAKIASIYEDFVTGEYQKYLDGPNN
jgi:hypothetical protein